MEKQRVVKKLFNKNSRLIAVTKTKNTLCVVVFHHYIVCVGHKCTAYSICSINL